MIKNIYVLKNNKGGFFLDPFVDIMQPDDMHESLVQFANMSKEDLKANMLESSLYHLGTFDTITGEINFNFEFVNDLGVKKDE